MTAARAEGLGAGPAGDPGGTGGHWEALWETVCHVRLAGSLGGTVRDSQRIEVPTREKMAWALHPGFQEGSALMVVWTT